MMVVFLGLATGTPLRGILGTAVLKANASMCNEIIVCYEICQGVNHGQSQSGWNLSTHKPIIIHDSWQLMFTPSCSSSLLAMLALSSPQPAWPRSSCQDHSPAFKRRASLISGSIHISPVAENQKQHHWASSPKHGCNMKLGLVLLQCKLRGGGQSY